MILLLFGINPGLSRQKRRLPLKEVSIIITEDGYFPSRVVVYEHEKVQLYITALSQQSSCLVVPDQNIFVSAHKEKITEKTLYFNAPGKYPFYCPTQKIYGELIVLAKNGVGAGRFAEKPEFQWRPREE